MYYKTVLLISLQLPHSYCFHTLNDVTYSGTVKKKKTNPEHKGTD